MPTHIIKLGVADDHPIVRNGISSLIHTSTDCKVIAQGENGKELINQIAATELPDICILDISMPVMDGYETISYLKNKYPEMKFLVLSVLEREFSIIRMIKRGANGYLLKSSSLEAILNALRSIHSHGYYYSDLATESVFKTALNSKMADLTNKEIQFLKLSCSELSYAQIAEQMCISVRTVHDHQETIGSKIRIKTRLGQALFAVQTGLVHLENNF